MENETKPNSNPKRRLKGPQAEMKAVETICVVLKPLSPDQRTKVLDAVHCLIK